MLKIDKNGLKMGIEKRVKKGSKIGQKGGPKTVIFWKSQYVPG
jgi:hypothetical protein